MIDEAREPRTERARDEAARNGDSRTGTQLRNGRLPRARETNGFFLGVVESKSRKDDTTSAEGSITAACCQNIIAVTALYLSNGGSPDQSEGIYRNQFSALSLSSPPPNRIYGPYDVVIWDSLPAHRNPELKAILESAQAQLLPLPPYSPDFNPIEPCWSKGKTFLRAVEARTVEALQQAIVKAFATVTAADARGWFQHGGYRLT